MLSPRRLIIAGFVVFATAAPLSPVDADDGGDHASELVARARAMELFRSEQWIRLGHWKQSNVWFVGAFLGWNSQADGPGLFLATNGKSSPEDELVATLRGFTRPASEGDEHPICRFPARYRWLNSQLHFDPARLPAPRCVKYDEYLANVAPRSAIVIFSSYFMSKAASAFGHTFLRIEKEAPFAGTDRRQLLDTGIDYSATVTTRNAALYALMGMIGGFRGTFRKLPYYYKVREYNDFDTRDIWEYRLALTDTQLALLVDHLWEMGSTYFDYFYFTENCSYHILSAIEVARPDIDLLVHIKTPVIPADTIRALFEVPGLVKDVSFRPSLMTQFRHRVKTMSEPQLDAVEKLASDGNAEVPDTWSARERIAVFDAAADLVDIKHSKTLLSDQGGEASRIKLQLLGRRARIAEPSADVSVDVPWHEQPHVGHGSRRVGVGGGFMDGEYVAMQFRMTLHDLADPVSGYPELSQIEFLPFEARYQVDDQALRFENASLIRIVHLNAWGRFNQRLSWKVDVGGVRIHDEGCDGCFMGRLLIGGGVARSYANDRLVFYATLDNHLLSGPGLDGIKGAPIRLGFGPAVGVRVRFSDQLISVLNGDWIWLPVQEPRAMWSTTGTLRWGVTRNIAIDISARTVQRTVDGRFSALVYY